MGGWAARRSGGLRLPDSGALRAGLWAELRAGRVFEPDTVADAFLGLANGRIEHSSGQAADGPGQVIEHYLREHLSEAALGPEQLQRTFNVSRSAIYRRFKPRGGVAAFIRSERLRGCHAAALLIPLMGFLPPGDERVRATVLAIANELSHGGLVLRYRVEATDDGLEGDEGTFTICSFWLVSALALIGEQKRARSLCEKLLSLAGPLQLYAEELDADGGQHLGNYPQAFTHLALIDAVTRLIESDSTEAAQDPDDAGGTE